MRPRLVNSGDFRAFNHTVFHGLDDAMLTDCPIGGITRYHVSANGGFCGCCGKRLCDPSTPAPAEMIEYEDLPHV